MMMWLDSLGSTVWRASWQGAALALLVILVMRCCGERLAARWRFLLWGVVLVRMLCLVTPGSSWSLFNLIDGNVTVARAAEANSLQRSIVEPDIANSPAMRADSIREQTALIIDPLQQSPGPARPSPVATEDFVTATHTVQHPGSSWIRMLRGLQENLLPRCLTVIWLAGCVWLTIRLAVASVLLNRRLVLCRAVSDSELLQLFQQVQQRLRLKRTIRLMVSPEAISPCVMGTWRPRVILPESIVTPPQVGVLRHVLAHEMAHVVRGDLWTNWLLLMVRTLHWFNPVAWWIVGEMQAEREAACDELVLAASGETEREDYALTILDLAAQLTPSSMVPGFIGLFSSGGRLQFRIERLLRAPQITSLRAPLASGLLVGLALLGLTDSVPTAQAQNATIPAPAVKGSVAAAKADAPQAVVPLKTHTEKGRCTKDADGTPLSGVTVKLYKVEGRTNPPVEIARTVSDSMGRYEFPGLTPPQVEGLFNRVWYGAFGFVDGKPIGQSFMYFNDKDERVVTIKMTDQGSTVSGRVVDPAGKPVAAATVRQLFVFDRSLPGLQSATTDADGRFKIDNVATYRLPDGKVWATHLTVIHPDYPETRSDVTTLPADITVTLPQGCVVSGTIIDGNSGTPAVGATIGARRSDEWGEKFASSDAAGHFRLVLQEGRYDFLVDQPDRVCVAVTAQECIAGQTLELPAMKVSSGGFITGQVKNVRTGQPVSLTDKGEPITIGYLGPSQPIGRAVTPTPLGTVDSLGRFTMRAPAGLNYPYFVNIHGDRMAWDTIKQPPVIVKEGEITTYDMLITPKVTPANRLQEARKLVATLSQTPTERTEQILAEFRKLSHTVDETEMWCLLLRELVAVGPPAIPQLGAELNAATRSASIRRLAFTLRAINDPRAVPALIRAIPQTLAAGNGDYGLIVEDKELSTFMRQHDLDEGSRSTHFSLGSPAREVFGALHKLTGQQFDDVDLYSMSLNLDPRRQVMKRKIYQQHAQRWQAWWEANAQKFTPDAAYQKVNLAIIDEPLPPAPAGLTDHARLEGIWQGATMSPAIQQGTYALNFYDLDTAYHPRWPQDIPRDESAETLKRIDVWAEARGVDLMCISQRTADGAETFVLRGIGMQVQEISARDYRNLDALIGRGKLPEGKPVGELLVHLDPQSGKPAPEANGTFLFTTREGSIGVIEITDHITRTADLTGLPAGSNTGGMGFFKGVMFNLKLISP